jgi:hypothetical protein
MAETFRLVTSPDELFWEELPRDASRLEASRGRHQKIPGSLSEESSRHDERSADIRPHSAVSAFKSVGRVPIEYRLARTLSEERAVAPLYAARIASSVSSRLSAPPII